MWLIERVKELWDWLLVLPPDFAFLLSLPILVALAGALAHFGRGPGQSD